MNTTADPGQQLREQLAGILGCNPDDLRPGSPAARDAAGRHLGELGARCMAWDQIRDDGVYRMERWLGLPFETRVKCRGCDEVAIADPTGAAGPLCHPPGCTDVAAGRAPVNC